MATLGYARVSTNGQDLTAQIEALKAAGAATIYREKVSGVRANRPELAKLMAKLMPDDLVIVTKLDRLGRSTRELLDLIERISKAGAAFRSLGDPLFDTTSSQGRLLSTLLAAIADFESNAPVRTVSAPWLPASSSAASASCPITSAQRRSSVATLARRSRRSPSPTALIFR
jgi:DNA invertase Pin-like site-specific DNA recombinase